MSIPHNENIPDNKAKAIFRTIYSFFDDGERTEYPLKVSNVSQLTNKYELLQEWKIVDYEFVVDHFARLCNHCRNIFINNKNEKRHQLLVSQCQKLVTAHNP